MGKCHHTKSDGFIPEAILTFFDDKGVWLYQNIVDSEISTIKFHCKRENFFAEKLDPEFSRMFPQYSTKFVIEDALLVVSLYFLNHKIIEKSDPYRKLLNHANQYFKIDIPKTININCNEQIETEMLLHLYELNKTFLRNLDSLKFIAVSLCSGVMKAGAYNPSLLPDTFLETMQDYKIKNYQLCLTYTSN
jgi:hypothetical protein